MSNTSTRIPHQISGVPRYLRHQDHSSLAKACSLLSQPLHGPAKSWKECLSTSTPKVYGSLTPSLQHCQTPPSSWGSFPRLKGATTPATKDCRWRGTLQGRKDFGQPFHPGSPPFPRVWLRGKLMDSWRRTHCPSEAMGILYHPPRHPLADSFGGFQSCLSVLWGCSTLEGVMSRDNLFPRLPSNNLWYPVFSHGQFYVGVSRRTNWGRMHIFLKEVRKRINMLRKSRSKEKEKEKKHSFYHFYFILHFLPTPVHDHFIVIFLQP